MFHQANVHCTILYVHILLSATITNLDSHSHVLFKTLSTVSQFNFYANFPKEQQQT